MKIGIIGIGDIAKKAYLPIISRYKELDIVLCSRNDNNLKEVISSYRGMSYVTSIDDLIGSDIEAAFVHTSTSAHFKICKILLLNNIHVYIDKPVSYHIEEVRELYRLAQEKNLILRTGFNRREAPLVKALKKLEKPDVVIYQKHRVNQPAEIRNYVFDDFIHVVDSIRYLLEDEIVSYNVKGKVVDKVLYSVTLQLIGKRGTAIGIMNRDSGKSEEKIEYMCAGEKRLIEDLNTLTVYKNNSETIEKFGDWDPVLYRRGFNSIIDNYIEDVKNVKCFIKKDEDMLLTHELCELVVKALEKYS